MNLNLHRPSVTTLTIAMFASAFLLLAGLPAALAQTVSSNPPNGATGVSASGPVVFTFSASVAPSSTFATFYSTSPPGAYAVNTNWNSGDTVLTCTPSPPFPANATISWAVVDTAAAVFAMGSFTTGTNSTSTGGGSGTNAITAFVVGETYLYQQLTNGLPTPETNESYFFIASTALASNRTANTITVTLPSGAVSNMLQDFLLPADYTLFGYDTNNARFESTFGAGSYVFNVMASTSNQQVTATMPASTAQPNAPHISNWSAAQSLNAAQAFTLTWDAFQGGGAAFDYIFLTVGDNVFQSGSPGTSNVLSGTATSVTIPANKLAPNSNYMAEITFFDFSPGTSNATYSVGAYRATATQFNIITSSAASMVPVVSNPVWGGGGFSFDVATPPAQVLNVLYSTDCSLPIAQWQTLQTTTSTVASVHITIPPQAGPTGFFRIQNGH